MRSRWERLGLRARVALLFAFGGLLLSVTISLVTLTFSRQALLEQREDAAFASFNFNARTGSDGGYSSAAAVETMRSTLRAGEGGVDDFVEEVLDSSIMRCAGGALAATDRAMVTQRFHVGATSTPSHHSRRPEHTHTHTHTHICHFSSGKDS